MADPTNTNQEDQTPNYLEMSDEDMMKAAPPAPVAEAEEEEDEGQDPPEKEQEQTPAEKTEDEAEEEDDEKDEGDDSNPEKELESDPSKEKDEKAKEPKADKAKEEKKPEEKVEQQEVVVDYEKEYKRLLAPFKANGREIRAENVDDAIKLMQMGANYNKKMAGLKPSLKLMKMLESNGFLDEGKLSFLIDLGKKDPAAIQKLVSESGIDPMDLNAEEAKKWKPTARTVNDEEFALDTTLDDLRESPSYTRMLDVVSNQWDAASQKIVGVTPHVLTVLDSHIASGIYDLIAAEVDREKTFGRLSGLSSIEAYKTVGDRMQAQGKFDHIGAPAQKEEPKQRVVIAPKKTAEELDKLKEKKRAAGSTKPSAGASGPGQDFNPLSMSDEEFSKVSAPKFS